MAKICPYCGSNNTDDSKFCSTCGSEIENVNQGNVVNNISNNPSSNNSYPNMNSNEYNGKQSESLSILSFVLSITGLFTCCLTSIVGLIVGIVALVKMNKNEISDKNKTFAIIGVVIGAIVVVMYLIILIPMIAIVVGEASYWLFL